MARKKTITKEQILAAAYEVAANEGFEVVRRRLFLDCKNPDGRDLVCSKFSQMYNDNQSDFPLEADGSVVPYYTKES